MTKEELDEQLVKVTTERQRLEEEMHVLAERPPPYMNQFEIDAEREHKRRLLEAYEAYEKKLVAQILALGRPRLK